MDGATRGHAGERTRATAAGFPLVAAAAALWGTDALFRRGLALELPAASVVLWEHVLLVVLVSPVLLRVPWRRLRRADWVALLLIGAGASALATILFTAAFRYGDPTTPLLLQKLQPFVAILGGRLLLGERLTPRFGLWLAAALACGWLVTFANPFDVRGGAAAAGGLAAGAAVLWGLGTVLGRRMAGRLTVAELTAARFGIGLPAALVLAVVGPGRVEDLGIAARDVVPLLLLALLPGLLALLLYYRGLRTTPASAATVAELAFPLTALAVNFVAFGTTLSPTQVLGVAGLSGVLVAMSVVAQRREDARPLGVDAPPPPVPVGAGAP